MSSITELLALLNVNRLQSAKEAAISLRDKVPETIMIDDDNGEINRRFILALLNRNSHSISPLHVQANGIIILFTLEGAEQWSLLVLPKPVLSSIYNRNKLIKTIGDYTIELANDGTILSLYWYNEKWCISTSRLLEANDMIWMSDKPYTMIVSEIFNQYDLKLDILDIANTYTFGFHHPDFHPFVETMSAWNVVNYEIAKFGKQEKVVFPANYSREKIVNEMLAKNATSMRRYIESSAAIAKNIHYGYILRSENSHIFLESDLFANIKRIYYAKPKIINDSKYKLMNEIIQRQMCDTKYRNMFIVLRAYMDYRLKYVALSLFPKFQAMYDEFDKFFNELSITILLHIHDSNMPLACKKEGLIATVHERSLDNLLATITKHIKKVGGLCATNTDSKSIVCDFLLDEKYTHVYINFLLI